jgi:hypothetical protein
VPAGNEEIRPDKNHLSVGSAVAPAHPRFGRDTAKWAVLDVPSDRNLGQVNLGVSADSLDSRACTEDFGRPVRTRLLGRLDSNGSPTCRSRNGCFQNLDYPDRSEIRPGRRGRQTKARMLFVPQHFESSCTLRFVGGAIRSPRKSVRRMHERKPRASGTDHRAHPDQRDTEGDTCAL